MRRRGKLAPATAFGYASPMRLLVLHAVVALACAGVATIGGCGGSEKPVKQAKTKSKDEKAARALLGQARDDAQNGDADAADEAYGKAYAASKDFEILEEHVDFLIHVGKPARAQQVAKGYYDAHDTDGKGFKLYAEALIAGGRGEQAKEVADSLIALDPNNAAGYEKLGRALVLMDRNEEGVEALRKAVQLDDDNAQYYISLGIALNKIGKVDEAALKFSDAVKRAPDDATAHAYLGMARRLQGEPDEAKQHLDKALELDPNNGRAYFELGLLYNAQKKQGEAEIALQTAVQKSPNESLFWYALGEIYRVQSRAEKALAAYKRANEIEPVYPKAPGKYGLLLVEAKKFDEAEAVLTPAVRRDPKNPLNYLALGGAFAGMRQTKNAIESYEKYLELAPRNDPERDRAQRAISDLKRRR